ncbi:MAG: AMP-binding protein, partial [Betaproteobacteria bacterium]
GQGRGDWEALAAQYPHASIVTDRVVDSARAFDVTPYLAMDTNVEVSPQPDLSANLIPSISDDFTAAILFTSGSTGNPTAHAKSWGQLVRGAANLWAALGWTPSTRCAVLGSVPSQHMFGLESTVMLPWYAGCPVHLHKPLLPADLESALAQCARPCWWMTTPVHLRPTLQAAIALPGIAGIVASTMNLAPALAVAAEATWQVPVVEIYGSTETGALATRRTASDEWWSPLAGVELKPQSSGDTTRILASGSHIDVPVLLTDELRFNQDGRFLWLGRSADMLKIGGKRASLSALNQRIAAIPGIDDAVFFAPDAGDDATKHDDAHPMKRLVAFYVSATLSPEQVRATLHDRLDPVFMPRPLFRVAQLPRDANGKLAHLALMGLYSQLRHADNTTAVAGNVPKKPLVVALNHPALPGHFPGNPIVPGVVILSQVTEAIRSQLPGIVPGTLLAMRFHAPLRPGQPFTVHAQLRGDQVVVEVLENNAQGAPGMRICSAKWACGTDVQPVEHA